MPNNPERHWCEYNKETSETNSVKVIVLKVLRDANLFLQSKSNVHCQWSL